ncbi:hypothetical protein ACWD26_21110 [Streptomyces sp. NPDC002787]
MGGGVGGHGGAVGVRRGAGLQSADLHRGPGQGLRVETISTATTWNGDFTGHFHIWGGGIHTNSATGFWGCHQKFTVPVHRDLPNGAVLCAEGWEHLNGGME